MLKGLTIQELAAKIEGNRAAKRDLVADTRTMEVVPFWNPAVDPQSQANLKLKVGDEQFTILNLAHNQIASRNQIPVKYYDRMRAEAPRLLASNVNHWFREQPERRMVRLMGSANRAFLSDRYQRIENEEIAMAALPVLAEMKVEVQSCEVTDRRMYIHFTVPGMQAEVKVGDVVQAGGVITNSEVGLGAVSVSGLIWRLRCLNGMKTSDAFRKYHVGRQVGADGEMDQINWQDDTRQADDRAILLKVRDMVRSISEEARFLRHVSKLTELASGEAKITGSPVEAIEVLSQKVILLESEKAGILRSLIEGADLSAWGMINAVTAQAHSARNYDRAVELEEAGGRLLDLQPREWKEVLQAA